MNENRDPRVLRDARAENISFAPAESAASNEPGRWAATDSEAQHLLTRLRNGSWLDQQEFAPLAWTVPGLIPEGFGIAVGPPKVGKSWFMLGLALALASGSTALGKIPTGEPRPVLLLALEDGHRRLQSRCRQLLGKGVPIPERLDFQVDTSPEYVNPLIGAWLAQHRGANPLVILDTLGKVMPSDRTTESAYQRDYRTGSALKRLTDGHPGSCLIAVHHTRKAVTEDWMDSTSGTNGLNGSADWTLNLSRQRGSHSALIRVTGRDVTEGEYAATTSDGSWTLDGAGLPEAAEKAAHQGNATGLGENSANVLDYVVGQGHPIGPKDVSKALGISQENARQTLRRLAGAGHIKKVGHGNYSGVTSVTLSPALEESPDSDDGTTGQMAAAA